jgi:hypothetical protein
VRGNLHLILIYVDDILVVSEDKYNISEIKKGICAEYDITDIKELDNFLNAKITRTRKNNSISQTHYCLQVKVLNTLDFLVQDKATRVYCTSMQQSNWQRLIS